MAGIALFWDNERGSTDIRAENGRFVVDTGLHTAVIISLFSNRRADESEKLDDPGGWWGNKYASAPGREYGSRIWIASKGNATAEVAADVKAAADEALQHLIDAGRVSEVNVEAEIDAEKRLRVRVKVEKPNGEEETFSFSSSWESS